VTERDEEIDKVIADALAHGTGASMGGKHVRVVDFYAPQDEIEQRILEPLTDEQLTAAANLDLQGSGFYSFRRRCYISRTQAGSDAL